MKQFIPHSGEKPTGASFLRFETGMEELNEEIEALQSIFPEETRVKERNDGSKLIEYIVMGEAVLSTELDGKLLKLSETLYQTIMFMVLFRQKFNVKKVLLF